jgi:ParB family chromosome partitioning protein
MSKPRGGLGRGLGALIPTGPLARPSVGLTPRPESEPSTGVVGVVPGASTTTETGPAWESDLAPVPGARFGEVRVDSIVPNPKQPRLSFDEDALEELKDSVREVGFLQPIVVREIDSQRYELVMGERRWRVAQALERETIPAIIRETKDEAMLRDALLENIHRADLNPLEEAAAYQQLLEEFGVTHEELARRIGRSRPQISNTIRLLNLPGPVQRRVAAGVLSAGHARALLGLPGPDEQDALAQRIVAEGLSVRATEELVALAATRKPVADPDPPKRRAKPHAPALTELADRLSDRFDTRVKVDIGKSKGKITIEFATVDDLERIVGIIGLDRQPNQQPNQQPTQQ